MADVSRFEAHPGQPLTEHLDNVANIAAELAAPIGGPAIVRCTGAVHDVGKATGLFQDRLHGTDDGRALYHKDEGVCRLLDISDGLEICAMLADGHHGGLIGYKSDKRSTGGIWRFVDKVFRRERAEGRNDRSVGVISDDVFGSLCPNFAELAESAWLEIRGYVKRVKEKSAYKGSVVFEVMMFTRMLFGALVEADYIDTEQAVVPDKSVLRDGPNKLEPKSFLDKFDKHMARKRMCVSGNAQVQRARDTLLDACRNKGKGARGIYRLSSLTGSGKTFASVCFSLIHALEHSLDRVIFVAPYTSITDQTYGEFKDIFGVENVLECSSTWDAEGAVEDEQGVDALSLMLKAEDWRAPMIVTTDVQFFDSLLGNKISKCRKLPAIANSVIVIDELQSIPPDKYEIVMDVLSYLVEFCGCSVLVMSATLPPVEGFVRYGLHTENVLTEEEDATVRAALGNRVCIDEIGWERTPDSLAACVRSDVSTLIVLNTRKQVDAVFKACKERLGDKVPVFALTRNMTKAHREQVVRQVKRLLDAGLPCVLVSTTIVEAGIDLDFYEGFRCRAGLASVFQTAGRVNRHGLRDTGVLHVFDFAEETELRATGWKLLADEQMRTRMAFARFGKGKGYDDEVMDAYLDAKYGDSSSFDFSSLGVPVKSMFIDYSNTFDNLCPNCFRNFDFDALSQQLRMIPDDGYHRSVFVPFAAWMDEDMVRRGHDLFERLEGVSMSGRGSFVPRKMQREMSDFSVDVPIRTFDELRKMGVVRKIDGMLDVWYVPEEAVGCYDGDLGLSLES